MYRDCRDHDLTAASAAAANAFDRTMAGYLAMAPDTGGRLKAAFAEDAEMPMAQVLKAYFFMLMASAPLTRKAQQACVELQAISTSVTPRERSHIDAATHWSAGRKKSAIAAWESILDAHPRDVLALRLAHHGHFYQGDGQNLRDSITGRLHAWSSDVPGFGYVEGMAAFGFEETHDHIRALDFGERAVAAPDPDPWAVHAVAHVHEMRNDTKSGLAWLADHAPQWQSANNFRYHVLWHRMLMCLGQGDHATVLSLYDDELWDASSDEYLDLVNDAAVLLRLELHGVDVGERWQPLAEKCQNRTTDQQLAFVDVHFAIALAAGAPDACSDLLAAMEAYAHSVSSDNAAVTAEVGIPLAKALLAHRQGNCRLALDLMLPRRYDWFRLGGSHAQRDLFAMVLIDVAVKAEQHDLAQRLLSERCARNDHDAWTESMVQRIGGQGL